MHNDNEEFNMKTLIAKYLKVLNGLEIQIQSRDERESNW